MNSKSVRVAKIIIVILIIILILLALYGVRKIGEIFKPAPKTETTEEVIDEPETYDQNEENNEIPVVTQEVESSSTEVVETQQSEEPTYLLDYEELDVSSIPEYDGSPYVVLNNNIPDFSEEDKQNPVFEKYSYLDFLGRCGVATANLGWELMPTEERGSIGNIKPSGWHTIKYPDLIEDLYLYNRCHLIAYSLTGENDNERNLITGTRYMNMSGMLPFENGIANYIEMTGNHVLYRVTPCFVDYELVARGVHIEAFSVEDDGFGICINVFAYNVQPGIRIDYLTGESYLE